MYLGYQAPIYELSLIVTFEFVICEIILTSQRRRREIKSGGRGGEGGCGAENKIGHSIFFRPPLPPSISNKRRPLLVESTFTWTFQHACSFLCSFALANILAIATGSIMSANILWQWTSMQPFNRSYIIVFLGCVLKRLRAEKLRSDVRDSYFLIMEVGHAFSKTKGRKPNWFTRNSIN